MLKSHMINSLFIVGLTGGIGSGKTVASDHFASLGVPVIDTDLIARQIVEPGMPALKQLVNQFGDSILLDNGALNRDALRNLVFTTNDNADNNKSNKSNKAKLDAITHPAIRNETLKQIEQVSYPYCLVVIPLLTKDSAFQHFMHRVISVRCNEATRIERVMKRSNLSREAVVAIVESQLSDEERADFADDVIDNNGSLQDVYTQVETLHETYLHLSTELKNAT